MYEDYVAEFPAFYNSVSDSLSDRADHHKIAFVICIEWCDDNNYLLRPSSGATEEKWGILGNSFGHV